MRPARWGPMPIFIQAGLWGLLGGSALVLGAVIAFFVLRDGAQVKNYAV